jgi:nicotinate-nucleotide adenylyltransferase
MQKLPRPRGKKIGLLGGSFNPAHAGHLYISRMALKHLKLDEIWWLVSPQNPLKDKSSLAPLAQRLASAERVARCSARITPTTIETTLGTRYTVDTLQALENAYPLTNFVWLMGADNLSQIHRWKNWKSIFRHVSVAVFDRAPHSARSCESRAAKYFSAAQVPENDAGKLALMKPPAWVFLNVPRHPASATALRQAKKW